MIEIIIFGATILYGFTFGIEGYDIYHHFSTPSAPLTIEIIISVNDDNDGRPLASELPCYKDAEWHRVSWSKEKHD